MIIAQSVPLGIDRGAPRVFTIEIIGIDLTGADMHAQIRLTRDAPGDPIVNLPKVTDPTIAGVRLVATDTSATLPVSWIRLQIPAMATGTGAGQLPPAAELGDDVTVYWDMFVTPNGRTTDQWFYGPVTISATVTKAATLPALVNDPLPGADAVATLVGADLSVTLAGAALIQPLIDRADGSAAAAVDAAAHAETKAQQATDAASAAAAQIGSLATPRATSFVDETNVSGGYASVATVAALASVDPASGIPIARRRAGMRRKVLGDDGAGVSGRVFELGNDLITWSGLPTSAELRDRSTQTGTQSADTITDGQVNVTMKATERAKIALIDSDFDQYVYGRRVVSYMLGATDRFGAGLLDDGKFYADFAIAGGPGIVITRGRDGSAVMASGFRDGTAYVDDGFDLYVAGNSTPLLTAYTDLNDRLIRGEFKDGRTVVPKLALSGGGGVTVTTRADGSTAIGFGFSDGTSYVDDGFDRYIAGNATALLTAYTDANDRLIRGEFRDGSTAIPGLVGSSNDVTAVTKTANGALSRTRRPTRAPILSPVMASPPTRTFIGPGGASPIAGAVLVPYNSPQITLLGMLATLRSTGGNNYYANLINGNWTKAPYAIEFDHYGADFCLFYNQFAAGEQIWLFVDDTPVSITPDRSTATSSPNSYYRYRVQFGSTAFCRIRIHLSYADFGGIEIEPTGAVMATGDVYETLGWLGDSWGEGTTQLFSRLQTIPANVARLLQCGAVFQAAQGGTGWANNGAMANKSLFGDPVRLTPLISAAPKRIVIQGSLNDDGLSSALITANVTAALNTLQAALPTTRFFAVGSQSTRGTPTANALANNAAFFAGVAAAAKGGDVVLMNPIAENWITGSGKSGSPAGDGNADTFVGPDGVHPTGDGAEYWAHRVARRIAENP